MQSQFVLGGSPRIYAGEERFSAPGSVTQYLLRLRAGLHSATFLAPPAISWSSSARFLSTPHR